VQIFASIVEKVRNPVETDWKRLGFFGGGAGAMAFLTFMKYRFIWWPLHPIGLAVGDNWAVWASAFSIFVTWLAKLVILRVGGIRGYERAKPFFLGMLVGYIAGVGLNFLVDFIWFPGQGHMLYHW
jgi:hypothetical protein